MRLRATVSFVGKASATKGQEFSCSEEIGEDLIRAGYAEKVELALKKGAKKDESIGDNAG